MVTTEQLKDFVKQIATPTQVEEYRRRPRGEDREYTVTMVSNIKMESLLGALSNESSFLPLDIPVKTNSIWNKENLESFSGGLIRSVVFSDGTLSAQTASHGGHYIEPTNATYMAAITLDKSGVIFPNMHVQSDASQLREYLGKQRVDGYTSKGLHLWMRADKRKR